MQTHSTLLKPVEQCQFAAEENLKLAIPLEPVWLKGFTREGIPLLSAYLNDRQLLWLLLRHLKSACMMQLVKWQGTKIDVPMKQAVHPGQKTRGCKQLMPRIPYFIFSPLAPPRTLSVLLNLHFHCSSLGDMGHKCFCFNKAHCVKFTPGFKTIEKCHSKSWKQWAIIFLWPIYKMVSKKPCFFNKLCHELQKRLQTLSLLSLLRLH